MSLFPPLRALAPILMVALAGCAVGPEYRKPELAIPERWSAAAPADADLEGWWRVFGDATLVSLVDRALAANLDLRIAEARIREARALRRVAAAGIWPAADASAASARPSSACRSATSPGRSSSHTAASASATFSSAGGSTR